MGEAKTVENLERVEPGQVWEPTAGLRYVVQNIVDSEHALFRGGGHASMVDMRTRWRCVGFELPDGRRVMVGERRGMAGEYVVERILHGRQVVVRAPAAAELHLSAEFVAGMPLHGFSMPCVDVAMWIPALPALSAPDLPGALTIEDIMAPLSQATGAALDAQAKLYGIDAERWRREAPRREINSILAEDARQHPAFAVARKSALLAEYERPNNVHGPRDARRALRALRLYEQDRGVGRQPSRIALEQWADTFHPDTLAAYERARGFR